MTIAYKSKLKEITEKIKVLEEERSQLLQNIVSSYAISVEEIPKNKEELSKLMGRVFEKNKLPWLDLRIVDVSHKNHKDLFLFGREKFILSNLGKIVEMIQSRKHCKMGNVGVTFYGFLKFNLWDFIKLA